MFRIWKKYMFVVLGFFYMVGIVFCYVVLEGEFIDVVYYLKVIKD